jgi:formate hydrogenlyase subunit 3/multisubunit Na+/H+ antiporter MnhD subunit
VLFTAGAVIGLFLAAVALIAMREVPQTIVLPLGLPDLPFHLRLDALSAFFLFLLGAAAAGISVFSAGYFRASEGAAPGLLCLQYHTFLAAMACVLVADDAYLFMVAWETMALASFFLVTTDHRIPEIRRAGFLYLLIAHIGALAILLCFGVLQGETGDYSFGSMRSVTLHAAWPSIAFLLALAGFGAKAGLLPLHVWLPEAHPAAPSPVSALMSGVMLKTAIYGLLRVTFDLLQGQLWWWGVLALVLGLATALFGVLFATVQTDMKRLLAYSSIENIGIIDAPRGDRVDGKPLSRPQSRVLQEPAVPRHRLGAARDEGAQPRQARRVDPSHAVGGLARPRGDARLRRPAAAQRVRLRVAAAAGVPVHAEPPAIVRQHARPAGGRGARARRGSGRVRDG